MEASSDTWRHLNIGRLLNNAINRFERRVLELMTEGGHGGVSYSHLHLTRNLDLQGTTTTELAKRAGMSKQAMAEIVARCEALGLVTRLPDPDDARAKTVTFTDTGVEWLQAFRNAVEAAEKEMRDELGHPRVDAMATALASYGASFDILDSKDRPPPRTPR